MALGSLIPFNRDTDVATSGTRDPFLSLRREMDRMFDDFVRGWPLSESVSSTGFMSPRVDVVETEKGLEITAELPGIEEKDIQLDLADDVLTLKAERSHQREESDESRRYHVVERSQGTFMRQFVIPFEADADKVKASFKNGVLDITVPRSASARKPIKRIKVNGG
ncbi:Hsp20/alpha crystallin family protein [Marinicauda algicola]|uniref:Hsp20/alpha crystallin family protein n=1 Tax=Marinicauda algicola TaxID=2029849 RepID=A0A4S2GYH9_9PROT|nr:Hsp20/alpha crystallin family protein [Marinicauda algicola]TGY88247.1 Hsp20/alpha crystallin family protein [Marinicauda algicola]